MTTSEDDGGHEQREQGVAAAYAAADAALRRVLDDVPTERWSAPSPCEGWTAADVVEHLVTTQRALLEEHGARLGPAPEVGTDPARAWRTHADAVRTVLGSPVPATTFEGFFGPTTVGETLERFYVWDMVVHRWDVARAVGLDPDLTSAELDRVDRGAEGFGDALHMEGICAPALDVPAGASRETAVLARLGRRA
ncbi:TIGR03086 family metal-binding protein [Pseudokineococcus basanitobsidens]|uniref:TIGR03086 family metal-binding protein n=1 Tax=Pseudokineococcus basanitobsidens TaxID=1926649 RepID=A0ABU8RNX3_9ACTN